jgi:hypothetical protein
MIGKRFVLFVLCLTVCAAAVQAGPKEFTKGAFYLTPQAGFNSFTIPFGVNAEFAISPNIGIGGTAMAWLWSEEWYSQTVISLAAEALYHFTGLKAAKFDLFAGAGLGYSIYSYSIKAGFLDLGGTGGSGLHIGLILGGRYWFSPKMAVSLRLNQAFLGDWGGFGGQLGVTFRMK